LTLALFALTLALSVGSFGASGAGAAGLAASTAPPPQASAASPRQATCRGTLTLPNHSNLALMDAAIVCLIDRERAHYQLPALTPNRDLQGIASSLSREMAASGDFADDSLTGETPWQRINASPYAWGARTLYAAQNIGWGTDGLATPTGVVNEWMHSAPHRHIILTGNYRNIGAGVAPIAPSSLTDEKPGATYTVEFAARG
jgi:uncharacterized protein YkwD